MIGSRVLAQLREEFQGQVKENQSLRGRTTFRCSAVARALVIPQGIEALASLVRFLASHQVPWGTGWRVIGRGSNLLVRDGGYSGILIDLAEGFSRIEGGDGDPKEVRVRAEGGVPNGALLSWACEQSLAGFGWSYGIPGSVGGGVRMNAGTPLGCYSQFTRHVEGVDPVGGVVSFPVTEKDFQYRDFPLGRDLIITAAHLVLHRAEAAEVKTEIEAAKLKRKGQPIDLPNFGSVFKNPTGDFAGRLIEAAGLKGLRIGDAEISKQHANFIVNLGSAKTSDVLALMKKAQEEVRQRFDLDLEAEVHLIGEDV